MQIFPSLPNFHVADNKKMFILLLFGLSITISGTWFGQIAYFSKLISNGYGKQSVPGYLLCLYLPVILSALLWPKIQSVFSIKSIAISSQVSAALFTAVQMVSLSHQSIVSFYIATFIKGFSAVMIFLIYDALTVACFDDDRDINDANALLLTMRYGTLVIFPILGAYCAETYGDISAISIDGISSLIAALIFLKINFVSLTSIGKNPEKVIKGKCNPMVFSGWRSYGLFCGLIITFLTYSSYSIFNYLLPVYVLDSIHKTKHEYGVVAALSGLAFIVAGKISSLEFVASANRKLRVCMSATMTALNGIFLYLAFSTIEIGYFYFWMLLASFVSLISIVSLKTLIFSENRMLGVGRLPALYNGFVWTGTSAGYVLCIIAVRNTMGNILSEGILIILSFSAIMIYLNFFRGTLKNKKCCEVSDEVSV